MITPVWGQILRPLIREIWYTCCCPSQEEEIIIFSLLRFSFTLPSVCLASCTTKHILGSVPLRTLKLPLTPFSPSRFGSQMIFWKADFLKPAYFALFFSFLKKCEFCHCMATLSSAALCLPILVPVLMLLAVSSCQLFSQLSASKSC